MGEKGGVGMEQGMSLRSGGLSSERDRERLRARQMAERARVERVLARGPREVERRREALRVDRPAAESRAEQGRARRAARRPGADAGCAVCGGSEIHEDEVFEGGFIRLGWCRRCDHRWTERLSPRLSPRFSPRVVPRVRRSESRSESRAESWKEAEVGRGA